MYPCVQMSEEDVDGAGPTDKEVAEENRESNFSLEITARRSEEFTGHSHSYFVTPVSW